MHTYSIMQLNIQVQVGSGEVDVVAQGYQLGCTLCIGMIQGLKLDGKITPTEKNLLAFGTSSTLLASARSIHIQLRFAAS